MDTTNNAVLPQKRDNHTPSCAVCQRRKVKCDRVYPCAACTKSGLECAFPPARHTKKPRRSNTTTHHHAAQQPARFPGHAPDPHLDRPTSRRSFGSRNNYNPANHNNNNNHDFPSPESTHSTGSNGTAARLVSDGSGYRYVNNHLWSAIDTEGQCSNGSPGTSPGDRRPSSPAGSRSGKVSHDDSNRGGDDAPSQSFIFGTGQCSSLSPIDTSQQLPATQIVFLWQTYLANVDPVMKISHAPTIQHILLGQIGRTSIPRNEKALISAIYFISAVSLTDEACRESPLHEPRAGLIQKYRELTEQALSAAGLITTTDTMVLQSLILYLAALRSLGELQMVWSLFGIAIRIAGTIGLQKDGTSFGLSPFETELRRRLWWGIVYFDGRMAELVGQEGDLMGNDYEASPPANLHDSDLFPTMTRLPDSRKGPTESVYLQARILSVTSARSLQSATGPQGTWHRLRDASLTVNEKLDIIDRIEQRYNEEILCACDPTVPLQWLSINTARTFATKLRLIARIPIVDRDQEWENADGFSENAFLLSMELLQLQVDLWCEPSVQQWRWHWQAHFQWHALVCLLRQTRLRQAGHGISRAWTLIQKAFQIIIPSLELGPRKSLLLDGVHALLNAAKEQKEPPPAMVVDQTLPTSSINEDTDMGSTSPARLTSANGFSAGYGAQPHSAMLPGMYSTQIPTPTSFGNGFEDADVDDPFLAFNMNAIDWVELDKYTLELCQQ